MRFFIAFLAGLAISLFAAITATAQPGGFGSGRGPGGAGGQDDSGGFTRVHPVIEALDADADGVISAKEIEKAAKALKKLDKNEDGRLTEDEFRPNAPAAGPRPSGRPPFGGSQPGAGGRQPFGGGQPGAGGRGFGGPGFGGGQGFGGGRGFGGGQGFGSSRGFGGWPGSGSGRGFGGGQGAAGDGSAMAARALDQNDENKDGKLSGDEIPAWMRQMIDRADTNDDGAIDKTELEKTFRAFRGGGGSGGGPSFGGGFGRVPAGGGARNSGDSERPRRPPAEE